MTSATDEAWVDIRPMLEASLPGEEPEQARVWEWSLVLTAMGIEHQVRQSRGVARLLVRTGSVSEAVEEIRLYELENSDNEELGDYEGHSGGFEPTFWAFLALAAFFKVVRLDIHALGYQPIPWQKLGSVNAEAVLSGAWWRTITGLTLHGDLPHLLSNILIGGVFIIMASRELGSGISWFLVLLSGTLGNFCNALIQGPPHDSIGFSTAVFGCVGIIAALRSLEHSSGSGHRRFLPAAAALGLLALLGSGGENTDLGAHLLGLACGFPLGLIAAGLKPPRPHPGRWLNLCFGWGAAGLVLSGWACALLASSPLFPS